MSVRNGLRGLAGIAIVAGWIGIAGSASALPLTYNVVVSESNSRIDMAAGAGIDVNPDFLDLFPQGATLAGTSNTFPLPSSNAVADVGLPGSFDPATGITFSELTARFGQLPGTLTGFGTVTVPLDITGSGVQFVAFTAKVSSFSIVLDAPLSSPLVAGVNPNEWLWAGAGNVTISGTLDPIVSIPGQPDITLGSFPFSQAVTMPLAGTFSGIPTGSQVTLGIPLGSITNQTLTIPPINVLEPIDLLGLVTGTFSIDSLVLTDLSTAIVYRNATPIPEPGTAALLGLGLVVLARRRRR